MLLLLHLLVIKSFISFEDPCKGNNSKLESVFDFQYAVIIISKQSRDNLLVTSAVYLQ